MSQTFFQTVVQFPSVSSPLGTQSLSGSIKFAEAKGNFEYKLYYRSQSQIQNQDTQQLVSCASCGIYILFLDYRPPNPYPQIAYFNCISHSTELLSEKDRSQVISFTFRPTVIWLVKSGKKNQNPVSSRACLAIEPQYISCRMGISVVRLLRGLQKLQSILTVLAWPRAGQQVVAGVIICSHSPIQRKRQNTLGNFQS